MLWKSDRYWHVIPKPKSLQNPVSFCITCLKWQCVTLNTSKIQYLLTNQPTHFLLLPHSLTPTYLHTYTHSPIYPVTYSHFTTHPLTYSRYLLTYLLIHSLNHPSSPSLPYLLTHPSTLSLSSSPSLPASLPLPPWPTSCCSIGGGCVRLL